MNEYILNTSLFYILLTAGILLGCYEKKRNDADFMNKLDFRLQKWYAEHDKEPSASATAATDSIEVIIHTRAPEEIKKIGVIPMTQTQTFVTAKVSYAQLQKLIQMPSVRLIETGATNYPQK